MYYSNKYLSVGSYLQSESILSVIPAPSTVIPAKAGIQETTKGTGFRLGPRGMTQDWNNSGVFPFSLQPICMSFR